MTANRRSLRPTDAEQFVNDIVFGSGDPASAVCGHNGVGVELEWITARGGRRLEERECREVIKAVSPLPFHGTVTVEPGGQLELSTQPYPDVGAACRAVSADLSVLDQGCAQQGISLFALGADPLRQPQRIVDAPRYRAMQEFFDATAPAGRTMMCNTASIQANVGLGPTERTAARRWRVANALGPTLIACFANSPFERGCVSGWKSTRLRTWWAIDPTRSAPVPITGDPAAAWLRYALDAQVMLIRTEREFLAIREPLSFEQWMTSGHELGWPTQDDFAYHLSTLFPPVRPRGWLEIRYLDAIPTPFWQVAAALIYALLVEDAAGEEFIARCGTSTSLWVEAARVGLSHPVLADAGRVCFALAIDALEGIAAEAEIVESVGTYSERWVAKGRCPGDDWYDGYERNGSLFPDPESPIPWTHDSATVTQPPMVGSRPGTRAPSDVTLTQDDLRRIASELVRTRARTLALVDCLDEADQVTQHSPLMSPMIWDLAHVGNYEELWLLRALDGRAPIDRILDNLYNAFEHPRWERPSLPLLGPAEARAYIGRVRAEVLALIDRVNAIPRSPVGHTRTPARIEAAPRLLEGGFVYGMVIQHEQQHCETLLATHQLMGERAQQPPGTVPAPVTAATTGSDEVLIAGGPFVFGVDDEPWAYDNERSAHEVDLPPFYIDRRPVTNAAYREFLEDGGYNQRDLWSKQGWSWRQEAGLEHPEFWRYEGERSWSVLRFGWRLDLDDLAEQPVQHVCWYEAEAFARWAGKRLPTEAEWEKAATWDPVTQRKRRFPWGNQDPDESLTNLGQRYNGPAPAGSFALGASAYGVLGLIGDVWEWTASDFCPYPGYTVFPYEEYSKVFFGPEYKVLRGGSWATDPIAVRGTFRNWDYPIRRQIFVGFRCARDG
ncbi:MAG: ergothioneine biosynthesis protein EgtB [Acidimicrobiales bacterium]|nr:ergothioneine biosynthesis protein EgtB [Acidimicrobiales bacterium]